MIASKRVFNNFSINKDVTRLGNLDDKLEAIIKLGIWGVISTWSLVTFYTNQLQFELFN